MRLFDESQHPRITGKFTDRPGSAPESGLVAPVAEYAHDQDHGDPTESERLALAETWGVSETTVANFGALRSDPQARLRFVGEWDEEPALDHFEDFVEQASENSARASNSRRIQSAAEHAESARRVTAEATAHGVRESDVRMWEHIEEEGSTGPGSTLVNLCGDQFGWVIPRSQVEFYRAVKQRTSEGEESHHLGQLDSDESASCER